MSGVLGYCKVDLGVSIFLYIRIIWICLRLISVFLKKGFGKYFLVYGLGRVVLLFFCLDFKYCIKFLRGRY